MPKYLLTVTIGIIFSIFAIGTGVAAHCDDNHPVLWGITAAIALVGIFAVRELAWAKL